MLLALVVLVGFGFLFMFASHEGMQGADQSIESVIAQQAKEIGNSRGTIEQGNKKLATAPALVALERELSGTKRKNIASKEMAATLGQSIEQGKAELETRKQTFEAYKNEYRAYTRSKSKGENLAVLETRTGAIYKNVTIREVTPIGIQIRHDEGQKRIPFEDLSDEMIDYYQFDPNQKAEALVAETATRNEHEAQAVVANGMEEEAKTLQREKDAAEKQEKVIREMAVKKGQIDALKDEIRNLEAEADRAAEAAATARAAGRMHINKTSSISGNIRSKQNRISSLQAEILQMQSGLQ